MQMICFIQCVCWEREEESRSFYKLTASFIFGEKKWLDSHPIIGQRSFQYKD